jgi:DNA-binding GntR family transcriptional regulator
MAKANENVEMVLQEKGYGNGAVARPPLAPAFMTRATLTEQCYSEIKRRILNGELAAGERLNEKQLAAALMVSPTPVREALNKLRSDGLITYSAWQGAAVLNLNADDLAHLYDIRCALEGLAIREACPNLASEDLDYLDGLVARAAEVMSSGEAEAQSIHELNHLFHQFIIDRTGNPWLAKTMEGIQDLLVLARNLLAPLESGKEAYQEHLTLMAALRSEDWGSAETIMVAHIQRIKYDLLRRALERTSPTEPPELPKSERSR